MVIAAVLVVILMRFFGIWVRAYAGGAPIHMLNLVAMWLRKSPMALIVDSRITASKAGLNITADQLQAHHMAGGDVSEVVLAMIAAEAKDNPPRFDEVCAVDLAYKGTGKSVLEAVRSDKFPDRRDFPAQLQEAGAE
jgi:uncharacterized protein YqfA (UPF0365 family)